ncbi:hypothetical protein K470DRAFT_268713 [Piedraia hortae CBS 480.64]|uniref:26S proteasome complex subunit SEM1 n=1 Tax=Piedraia hortae CBS 480.64 TaxID=1314780 RepID=A0A6A7C690_9PEZI|nr:hypothetical protein K470DRAFT_268713 [Piedraia hortae CBS 480.64]
MSNATSTPANAATEKQKDNKPKPTLEEDDEFEDFPVEDWPDDQDAIPSSQASTAGENETKTKPTTHLWEESWDDDDATEDFGVQLK